MLFGRLFTNGSHYATIHHISVYEDIFNREGTAYPFGTPEFTPGHW